MAISQFMSIFLFSAIATVVVVGSQECAFAAVGTETGQTAHRRQLAAGRTVARRVVSTGQLEVCRSRIKDERNNKVWRARRIWDVSRNRV